MWVLKTRGFDKENIFVNLVIKNKVSIHYYPVNHYLKKEIYYFIATGIVEGQENNIKTFFRDLKKETKQSPSKRWVEKLEIKGNFFICITAQHRNLELEKYVHLYYDPKIIHINPAVIDPKGYETWNVSVINKKDIEDLIKIGQKKYNAEILSFTEKNLKNIGILSILPEITDKQKNAFLLAHEHGYYEYPRQIELEKLAKISKIALSTYQAHLRKAERSFLGFIAKKYF
jgi:predicted DNA binding protein